MVNTLYSIKTRLGLLNQIKPVSRQNIDIDFRTLVRIALEKVTCFFLYAKRIHVRIYRRGEKRPSIH